MWVTIIISGLLTYALRLSFIILLDRVHVPALLAHGLRFVPLTVLAAIIAPALFLPQGHLEIGLSNARLCAGLLAIVVAWRTKNVFVTILVGMVCLLVLQYVLHMH